ncbi:lysophospholipid acyltransferase family protein [Neobacillus sp. PS3-34]|uniref:lysophospholipid acyltransferase family protein n=1 Tax=Neobacillus sp. PS3-34 TaxID=3070678 RepID=UPI0027E136DC|nr:lysophospholipid acyltransferase family protein [Neobacillus sp. PS3-34]WML47790.1 lysophospholipid acyltransferase family protein [Neobacillus sp. PS3-34]
MIRLIACFLYMSGYLVYSIPALKRMKKLAGTMLVSESDPIIHKVPKQWSKTMMNLTGSTVKVEGEELIPEGPVVLICNHEGDFDIPVLLSSIKKPFGFVSKIEVKKVPILSSWMEVMNCVFIDRNNRPQAIASLRKGAELLKKGHSIVIFPEGTRSKGGPIGTFKVGGFRLAKDANVPIVPISIEGTSDVFEKNGWKVKPAYIKVNISHPITSHINSNKDVKLLAEETKQIIISFRENRRMVS